MRDPNPSSFETLESRQLLAGYSVNVKRASSPITVTATLDGESLAQTGGTSAGYVLGTSNVSYTRNGISFSDVNNNGIAIGNGGGGDVGFGTGSGSFANSGLDIVDRNGQLATFTFEDGDGRGVYVANVAFGLSNPRAKVRAGRFSTRPIDARIAAGSLGVTGVAVPAELRGSGAAVLAGNGRARQSGSSLGVTVPFTFTIETQVNRLGRSQQLDVTFSGTLVGTGVSQSSAGGSTGIIVNPFAGTTRTTGRLADDIFG